MRALARKEWRAKVALASLVLMSLLSLGRSVIESQSATRAPGMPDLKQYEIRFAPLRKALPRREVIGYFDDQPNPQYEPGDYYAAQYVLTPIIVLHSDKPQFVIGNFVCDGQLKRFWPSDLVPVQDFGRGVVLFEKKSHRGTLLPRLSADNFLSRRDR